MATSGFNDNLIIKLKTILEEFCSFIEPYREILNHHNVQFLVDDHWSKFLNFNHDLVKSLEELSAKHKNLIRYSLDKQNYLDQNEDLNKLLIKLQHIHDLWSNHVLTNVDNIKFKLQKDENLNKINENYKNNLNIKSSDRFMTEKKSHEVDEMSCLIAKLCKYSDIDTVIDVGSGKGYLSAQLSYLYDLNVIAIDSSQSNVDNTIERLNKMKKQTNLNLKNFEENTKFQTFQQLVNINTNLGDLIRERLDINLKSKNYSLIGLHTCGELANSLVKLYLNNCILDRCLLCNVSCCYHLLNEKHAPDCYNFISFLNDDSNKSGDNIARIGCGKSGIIDLAFPMSSILNEKKFYLGRNARMISSQPIDRLLTQDEVYDRGLWYRSVLQIIFKEIYNLDGLNIKVGKLAPKCENFQIYVRKALNKLKLDNSKLTDADIDFYWNRYLNEQNKFKIYFQFKLLFSPIVEYIILLDRLIYLIENTTLTHSSYLVQLFNPIKSPRCYALISF